MTFTPEFREMVAAAGLSALLFVAGFLLPLAGPAVGFFASAPLIWLTARRGTRPGALAGLIATAAILAARIDPPAAAIFALEHALPGWFLGVRLARGGSIFRNSAAASIVVTGALLLFALVVLKGPGPADPAAFFDRELRSGLESINADLGTAPPVGGKAPMLPPEFLELLAFMRRVFPALACVGIFIACSLNSLFAARMLARSGSWPGEPPALTTLALPENLIWAVIPCLALIWWPSRDVVTVALNITIPLLFAYLLQGLSIVLHWLARVRISRLGLTLVVLGLLLQPYLLALPLLVGLLDFRFDFRRRHAPPTPPSLQP